MEQIEAEAETLFRSLGVAAYAEARRREHEASCDMIAEDWRLVASVVARLSGSREDFDSSCRLATNVALIPDRELTRLSKPPSSSEPRRPDERSVVGPTMESFRIQCLSASPEGELALLKEVEIQASNSSAAIVAAATLDLPPDTTGLRILDCEDHEVFARAKGA